MLTSKSRDLLVRFKIPICIVIHIGIFSVKLLYMADFLLSTLSQTVILLLSFVQYILGMIEYYLVVDACLSSTCYRPSTVFLQSSFIFFVFANL